MVRFMKVKFMKKNTNVNLNTFDMKIKTILSPIEESNLDVTPPSFIEWSRDTSTANPKEYIYFDAYLIKAKEIE